MPKLKDINKVLIIGSGPIIIGQACEFDYSGTQACKALRKLGYEIVLVNSNPATIMTDPETADVTYIEPLNVDRLEQIIAKERPDALLPNLGGQSGLNLCSELYQAGILDKYNVKVIGVQVDAIERGEDRIEFKKTMDSLGIEMARSEVAYTVDEALAIADKLGYPVVLRPAYTMGGAGGGLVYNKEELATVCSRGLQASLVGQVLVEESILGWEELELEVVRDSEGNMITVCFIENIDPLGVHTGDSFCSAPMLTISEECQKRLQEQAYKIVDKVQVIGGTNVQFASASPHSACALAGEKTASVKEKKYFSDSEEETACLGPRCCGFKDAGLWGADASLRGCVSSASGLSQVWGRSWRGQMQCPELLWGAVRTQSRGDGALWPASPQQHQQRRWGLSSWGAGVPVP